MPNWIWKLQPHLDRTLALANFKGLLQWLAIDRLDAGGQFVLPSVPGTGDAAGLDFAIGKRSALMGAHSIDGIKLAVATKDGQNLAVDHHFDRSGFGNRVTACDLDPLAR